MSGLCAKSGAGVIHRFQNDDGLKAAQPQARIHDPMHRRAGFVRNSTS